MMIQTQLCSTLLTVLISLCIAAEANSALRPPGTADLIESLHLNADLKGVEVSDGLCPNREGTDASTTTDLAYTISDRSVARYLKYLLENQKLE